MYDSAHRILSEKIFMLHSLVERNRKLNSMMIFHRNFNRIIIFSKTIFGHAILVHS